MKSSIYCALMLAGALVIAGCVDKTIGGDRDKGEGEVEAVAAEIAIPVEVATAERRDISLYFETTTRVMAENRVDVTAKGTGLCTTVNVEEGDLVDTGEVLAQLETEEIKAQIRQQQVSVEQQKAAYEVAERSFKEGIGSKVERDNALFAYEQALAQLETQRIQLANQTIVAPIDGIITQRNIQQGMLVSSGFSAFSVVDPASFVLPISPPERQVTNLEVGQEAIVTIDSAPGEEFVARVKRINPSVDPASGTVKVLLEFTEAAQPKLRESAFARVQLVMDTREDVLAVAKDTILEEGARQYLMVVEPDPEATDLGDEGTPSLIARRVEIETGLEDSTYVEIVNGIEADTPIVTLGQHTLKPGSPVVVTDAAALIAQHAGITPDEALEAAKDKSQDFSNDRDRRRRSLRSN